MEGWSDIEHHDVAVVRSAEAVATAAHLARLRDNTRQAALRFSGPLLLYGIAGVISAGLLAWTPLWVYSSWWLAIAVLAPLLVFAAYRRHAAVHGVGITPSRATCYAVVGEAFAAFLWLQPWHPIPINAPWLALAAAAAMAGRTWRVPTLHWVAVAVTATVVIGAFVGVPMALTDLVVGLELCVAAGCLAPWHRPRGE